MESLSSKPDIKRENTDGPDTANTTPSPIYIEADESAPPTIRDLVKENVINSIPANVFIVDSTSTPPSEGGPARHDTVKEFRAIRPETEIFFNFLHKHNLIGGDARKHVGISLEDGRKMDVVRVESSGSIRFEYDVPINMNGTTVGYRMYDLIFSEETGDCLTCNTEDRLYAFKNDEENREVAAYARELKNIPWKGILADFVEAFGKLN